MFEVKFLSKDLLKSLANKKSLTIDDEKYKVLFFNEKLLEYYEEIQKDEYKFSLQLRKYPNEKEYLIYGQNNGNEYLYDGAIVYLSKK